MKRQLLGPNKDLTIINPITVAGGGTGAITKAKAQVSLDILPVEEVGTAGGLAIIPAGGLTSANFAISTGSTNSVNLQGPTTVTANTTNTYTITDFDTSTTYTVSAVGGTATIAGSVITLVAGNGSVSPCKLTVNTRTVNVAVEPIKPVTPSVLTPANGSTSLPNTVIFTSSAFAMTSTSTDTHASTDWQVSTDNTFASTFFTSADDTVNKTTISVSGLSLKTTYYVRLRFKSSTGAYGNWSPSISFSTKTSFGTWKTMADDVGITNTASFGYAVAVSDDGNTVAGSAYNDLNGKGSVIILTRGDSGWVKQATIVNVPQTANEFFGTSISISGDGNTVAIGATETGSNSAGSVYVSIRNGTTWSAPVKLPSTYYQINGRFGTSIGLSNDGKTVIVGAPASGSNTGIAFVFTRSVNTWTLSNSLVPSDPAVGDGFGSAVAISNDGNTAVISAPSKDSGAGAVYVFTRSGTTWTQAVRLSSGDSVSGDGFGSEVAISDNGNTIAVSANSKTVGSKTVAGVAYIFTKSGATWPVTIKLTAGDYDTGTQFGKDIALSSDGLVLVAGRTEDSSAGNGSTYLFTLTSSGWFQQQKITDPVGATGDRFGCSVALDSFGSVLVVGSPLADANTIANAGGVFIYDLTSSSELFKVTSSDTTEHLGAIVAISGDGNTIAVNSNDGNIKGSVKIFVKGSSGWTLQTVLTATDAINDWGFGSSAALSYDGNTVAIGASHADSPSLVNAGAAYVFTRSSGTWTQQGKLLPNDPAVDLQMGVSIAISGDGSTVAVGSINYSNSNGKVYLYARTGATWAFTTSFMPATILATGNQFGCSVTLTFNGSYLAIGEKTGTGSVAYSGAVYVYRKVNGTWAQTAKIVPSDTNNANAHFGISVSFSADGSKLIVGADNDGAYGAVYIFTAVSDTTWTQTVKLTEPVRSATGFGCSVSVSADGNALVIGASMKDSNRGAVYVYTFNSSAWVQNSYIKRNDLVANSYFGRQVCVSGDGGVFVVGADGVGTSAGAFYIYDTGNKTQSFPDIEVGKIRPNAIVNSDEYGRAVYVSQDGKTIAVASFRKFNYTGAVYIYSKQVDTWNLQATILASDGAANDCFGTSITLSQDGNTLVVGATGKDTNKGAAYVFTRSGNNWTEVAILKKTTRAAEDCFGISVSVSANGDTIAVGAYDRDTSGVYYAGSVYIFVNLTGSFTLQSTLSASDKNIQWYFGGDSGVSLSENGNTLAVAARGSGSGTNGKAYIFTRSGTAWNQVAILKPLSSDTGNYFGNCISLSKDGKTVAIGYPFFNAGTGTLNSGCVYIFTDVAGTWTFQARLMQGADLAHDQYFGYNVDLTSDGSTLLVAASSKAAAQGWCYVFTRSGNIWNQKACFTGSDVIAGSYFGFDLAISGDGTVSVVGTPYMDGKGAAYIFQ